ncbi:MAG: peptide chain release factor N(5)-glutamine methyltransferase [Acidobacteriota bacterium]
MTFEQLTLQGHRTLARAGIPADEARRDANLLARLAIGWNQVTWLTRSHEDAPPEAAARYAALLARRAMREPMAYIRGTQEFWGREFIVSPAVLIPRPETELIVELANPILARHPTARVVDVGTGSGCLAITLALEHPGVHLQAIDVSEEALVVARTNAARLGADTRVTFLHGSYLADARRPVDLIVSNPPYVAAGDRDALPREVAGHEPAVALCGGHDGLRTVRELLCAAADALVPDGRLLMEIGHDQADRVRLETDSVDGLTLERIEPDLQGIPRIAVARRVGRS